MLSRNTIEHHAGFAIQDTELNGYNSGANTLEVGDVVFLHGDDAPSKTTKIHGPTGTHYRWRRCDEANGLSIASRVLRTGTIGVVKSVATNGATGDEIVVYVQGDKIPAKIVHGSAVTLMPQQPLFISATNRALSPTAAAQHVRFRSSLSQATINGTVVRTVQLDGLNGFGYDPAT